MCFRANLFRVDTCAGGLASTANDLRVQDLTITLSRPLVSDSQTEGTTTKGGAQAQSPEPVQDGETEITIGWNEPDFIAIASLVDDFKDDVQYKGDLTMTETIGSDAHQMLMEFGLMETMPADAGIDRQARVPLQREFRCVTPQATTTSMQTANPIHVELKNVHNISYETGA